MIARSLYTTVFIILLPVSFLLIFKPQAWQDTYSKLYNRLTASSQNPILVGLLKAFLSIASSEIGTMIHQGIGIFLGLIELYIFLEKLKVISLPFY